MVKQKIMFRIVFTHFLKNEKVHEAGEDETGVDEVDRIKTLSLAAFKHFENCLLSLDI